MAKRQWVDWQQTYGYLVLIAAHRWLISIMSSQTPLLNQSSFLGLNWSWTRDRHGCIDALWDEGAIKLCVRSHLVEATWHDTFMSYPKVLGSTLDLCPDDLLRVLWQATQNACMRPSGSIFIFAWCNSASYIHSDNAWARVCTSIHDNKICCNGTHLVKPKIDNWRWIDLNLVALKKWWHTCLINFWLSWILNARPWLTHKTTDSIPCRSANINISYNLPGNGKEATLHGHWTLWSRALNE